MVPRVHFIFLTKRKLISYNCCLTQTYITLFLESTECFLLAVMTLGHYVAICYPLRYLLIMKWSVFMTVALGAWTISFFFFFSDASLPHNPSTLCPSSPPPFLTRFYVNCPSPFTCSVPS